MRPPKVALLVGVLLCGGVIESAYQVRERVGAGPFGWMTWGGHHGPSFTYESEHSESIAEGTPAAVENSFGSVDVRPGLPGTLEVKLRKVVYLPNDEEARAFADRLVVKTEMVGGALRVTTNRSELEREIESVGPFRFDSIGFETHLSLRVPPGTEVEVQNEHGDVDVAEVGAATIDVAYGDLQLRQVSRNAKVTSRHGDATVEHLGSELEIDASYGELRLADIAGAVRVAQAHGDVNTARTGRLTLETQYGDLHAEDVGGDLEVRGEHSAVTARNVTGKADVETSYDDVELTTVSSDARAKVEHGVVKLVGIKGAASAETSFDDAIFEDIGGPLTASVEHGAVHASRIAGGAHVRADGDDVTLDGFKGSVDAEAKRGDVHLTPDGPLSESISVTSSYGDIHLAVPPGSRFELRAGSDSEDLEISLPGLVTSEQAERRVVGRFGTGGGLVRLEASHGTVHLGSQ